MQIELDKQAEKQKSLYLIKRELNKNNALIKMERNNMIDLDAIIALNSPIQHKI